MTFQRMCAPRRRSARIFRRLALVVVVCCLAMARSCTQSSQRGARFAPHFRRPLLPSRAIVAQTAAGSRRASAYGDSADHAVPIVVAAAQVIGSGRAGGKKDVLAFAGLHDDFSVFAIERFRIVELCRGEERRRRKFVELLAMVFKMQPVMDAML